MRALASLEKQGHITDSGERKGSTGQIKVYQVRVPDAVLLKIPKQSRLSSKEYRSSRQRVPHTVHDPYKLSVTIHKAQSAEETEASKKKLESHLNNLRMLKRS